MWPLEGHFPFLSCWSPFPTRNPLQQEVTDWAVRGDTGMLRREERSRQVAFPCLSQALASPVLKPCNQALRTRDPDQPSAAPLCWELLTTGSRQLQGWPGRSF